MDRHKGQRRKACIVHNRKTVIAKVNIVGR